MNDCIAAQVVEAVSLFRPGLKKLTNQNESGKVLNNRKNSKARPSIINNSLCTVNGLYFKLLLKNVM